MCVVCVVVCTAENESFHRHDRDDCPISVMMMENERMNRTKQNKIKYSALECCWWSILSDYVENCRSVLDNSVRSNSWSGQKLWGRAREVSWGVKSMHGIELCFDGPLLYASRSHLFLYL